MEDIEDLLKSEFDIPNERSRELVFPKVRKRKNISITKNGGINDQIQDNDRSKEVSFEYFHFLVQN